MWPVISVLAAVAVFIVAARTAAQASGVALHTLVRDGNQVADLDWYVGSISLLGVLLWASGSSVALAASFWTDGEDRACLRAFGIFGLVLAVDDGLMFHDAVLAAATDTTAFEPLVFAAYGLVAARLAWRFLPTLTPTAIVFGAASAALLAISGFVDGTGVGSAFIEDGFKFAGIAAWTGLSITQAGHAVRALALPPAGATEPERDGIRPR